MQGMSFTRSAALRGRVALAMAGALTVLLALGSAGTPAASGQGATATPVLRPGGRFEERDSELLYGGAWADVTDTRASGGTLRRSSGTDASVQLNFIGPSVRWVTTKGPDRGIARILIDGQDTGTVDLYAATEQFQFEITRGQLGETNHTIRVVVTGQRNGAASAANVDVDAFIVPWQEAPPLYRFEDLDPAIVYSGNWQIIPTNQASGGTLHRSNQGSSVAQFTFTGSEVTWVTSRGTSRGIARVSIDNNFTEDFDLYAATETFQVERRYTGLSDATHTIRVESRGARTGPATDAFVDVDAFVVLGAPTTPVPTATFTPAPTATMTPAASATPTLFVPTATPGFTPGPVPPAPPVTQDNRYFGLTGFRIDHNPFWDYFSARGGTNTFGYPVSRTFQFLGCTTQFFQRQLMQQCGTSGVQLMNLLDPDLMPYNQINFSQFPAHDPNVAGAAPGPGTANYGQAVLQYIRTVAPDTFEGLPVRFYSTFVSTVPGIDPDSDPNTAALVNLEIWGFPTSRPQFDPNNRSFVYMRFQRGIMHFDAASGATQGILLSDYFKSIITGRNLPPDLASQAAGSRFLAQYCPGAPAWVCRPQQLAGTDLTYAFERG